MTNMSDVVNNTPEGKKAVEKAVKQNIADQEAMSNTQPNVDELDKILEDYRRTLDTIVANAILGTPVKISLPHDKTLRQAISALITQAKKDLLAELLNLYGEPRCENLHHPKKWQHEVMKDCPVVAAIKEIEEGL